MSIKDLSLPKKTGIFSISGFMYYPCLPFRMFHCRLSWQNRWDKSVASRSILLSELLHAHSTPLFKFVSPFDRLRGLPLRSRRTDKSASPADWKSDRGHELKKWYDKLSDIRLELSRNFLLITDLGNSEDSLLNSVFFLRLPYLISFLCQGNELNKASPKLLTEQYRNYLKIKHIICKKILWWWKFDCRYCYLYCIVP